MIPLIDVILTGEDVYLLSSVIQGHLLDKKSRKYAVCDHYQYRGVAYMFNIEAYMYIVFKTFLVMRGINLMRALI